MNLKDILAISGKPGLFQLKSGGQAKVIVESLIDGKKMPVMSAHKISALEDISIYTYDDDIALSKVYDKIYDKENGGPAISHKSSEAELRAYMVTVLEDYDADRVYVSDLKKLFSWYNTLQKNNLLNQEESAEEKVKEAADKEAADTKAPEAESPAKED